MKEKNVAILTISREGREIALLLRDELPGVTLYSTVEAEGFRTMASLREGCRELIGEYSALIFCSALGICVRTVGDLLQDKHTDPAILCIDTTGHYVIPVASGHVGGATISPVASPISSVVRLSSRRRVTAGGCGLSIRWARSRAGGQSCSARR